MVLQIIQQFRHAQTLTLPITDISATIEAYQTNNLFTVTVNGNVCTDSITNVD